MNMISGLAHMEWALAQPWVTFAAAVKPVVCVTQAVMCGAQVDPSMQDMRPRPLILIHRSDVVTVQQLSGPAVFVPSAAAACVCAPRSAKGSWMQTQPANGKPRQQCCAFRHR